MALKLVSVKGQLDGTGRGVQIRVDVDPGLGLSSYVCCELEIDGPSKFIHDPAGHPFIGAHTWAQTEATVRGYDVNGRLLWTIA